MTKRGRPKKTIIKSDAQRALEYRLRKKKGVHHRCKALVGEPWRELKYPTPQRDVKIVWTGTYDEYVALPGEFGDFCYLPGPGRERPKGWRGRSDDYEPVIIDDTDPPVFDATPVGVGTQQLPELKSKPAGEELCPEEKATGILGERGTRGLDAAYRGRPLPKGNDIPMVLWRGKTSVTFEEYFRLRRRGPPPRCMRAVAKAGRPVGQSVELVPIEIIDAPAWAAGMDSDIPIPIDDWKECRSIVSEYTYRVARGSARSAYIEQPSYKAKRPHEWDDKPYEPMKPDRIYAKRQTGDPISWEEIAGGDEEVRRLQKKMFRPPLRRTAKTLDGKFRRARGPTMTRPLALAA